MPEQRITRRHLEEFAKNMARYYPEYRLRNRSQAVQGLWRVMEQDMRRYVFAKFNLSLRSWSAVSGESLDKTHVSPHIQREGVAFDRASLVQLPSDNMRWDYSLFGHDEDVWNLFLAWLYYLQHER